MTIMKQMAANYLERSIHAYRDAETDEDRTEAFGWIQEWLSEDPDVAADADLASYAETILRNRGFWQA